jgi:outer membrane protein assembly factor BamA
MFKKFIPTCVFIFIFFGIQFQSKAQYLISHITIEGNVKTKSKIILRELPYQEGSTVTADSLPMLNTIAKQQRINTALFYDAQVTSQITDSQHVKVQIKVSERWYLFPLCQFSKISG